MKVIKVGVIAGTPVDTQMGVEFLKTKGIEAVGFPMSSCPDEQSKMQILSPFDLTEEVRKVIKKIKIENINEIIIYCNSLSAAVDMDKLSAEEDIKIITPLKAYKNIANMYHSLGVLAANNQSSAGIERIIQSKNPECNVIGIGILPLVNEIETGKKPEDIINKFSLPKIMEFYNSINVDAVILGCTHFPYIFSELKKYSNVPIIDPAELMYQMI